MIKIKAPCLEYDESDGNYEDYEIEQIELLPQGQELYEMLGI